MAERAKRAAAAFAEPEELWNLPSGWRWAYLGAATTVIAGQSPPSELYNSKEIGLPFFQGKAEFGLTSPIARKWCSHPTKIAEKGDVLISVRAPVGPTNIADCRCGIGRGLAAVRANKDITSTKWLRHWLLLTQSMLAKQGTGTTFAAITGDVLRDHPVPMPPMATQAKIIDRVENLFAEIEAGESALADARAGLDTYRKLLLREAFSGVLTSQWRTENPPKLSGPDYLKLILDDRKRRWVTDSKRRYAEPVGPDRNGLPDLPSGWVWASLQQIAFISGGLTVDRKRRPNDPVEVPYLRVANVQRGYLDLRKIKTIVIERDELASLELKHGDILLNEGGDRDKIGRGWIWEGQLPLCAHQNHVFKARPGSDNIRPSLVSLYMNEMGRKFFIDQGKQTTNLASISLSKIARVPVPIPPPEEATAILKAISSVSNSEVEQTESLQSSISAAATLKQAILNAAFRGDLVQ